MFGRAQEKNKVFRTGRRRDREGKSYPWITRSTGIINQWYFYYMDADFGPFFLKFSSYFPYNAKLCINGNHWAQRQAARTGIGFEELDTDSPLSTTPPPCSGSATGWGLSRSTACCASGWPGCRTRSARRTGQRATATTSPCSRSSSPSPRCPASPSPGGSSSTKRSATTSASAAPARSAWSSTGGSCAKAPKPPPAGSAPASSPTGSPPSLHVDYKNSRIKQYHKLGRALRTETTINETRDFGIGKRLTNLPALREIGFTANRRLLAVQRLSHDPIDGAAALARVTDPVITETGSRVPGLRFTDPRARALLAVLCVFTCCQTALPTPTCAHTWRPCSEKTPGT